MKKLMLFTLFALTAGCSSLDLPDAAEDQDWRLASQAWTFRRYTFFETVDILAELGVHYIEAYPGQKIGDGLEGALHHTMPLETRDKVLAKLKEAKVTLVCYGVVNGKDEAEWRRIFEFAKAMGIESITTEPPMDQLDQVERLCLEFEINAALHNHPKPSIYWDPATVLKACENRSKRIGACADTGHWIRSGFEPLACLKKLEGRIISLHFKDLNRRELPAHDVPWGSGAGNAVAMLTEMKRQDFQGVFSIEYEHDTEKLVENVGECVAFFCRMAGGIAPTAGQSPEPAVMTDDISSVHLRYPEGAAGKWPDRIFNPDHDATYTCRTWGDTVLACGRGYANEGPENVFDKDPKTKWCIQKDSVWLIVESAEGKARKITSYSMTSANDAPLRDPRDWTLSGSNDGKTWKTLDDRKDESFPDRFHRRLFRLQEPAAYNRYKLEVTKNQGAVRFQLADMELIPEE